MPRIYTKIDPSIRFWRHVDKSGGDDACWVWRGAKYWDGYGIFGMRAGHVCRAHRFSWELTRGDIPESLQVLHRCDNPPCVNPAHLFLGTPDDNVRDKMAKGRQSRSQGSKCGKAKLSEADVIEMRRIHASATVNMVEIGERFGVDRSTVSKIVNGHGWRHCL